MLEVMRGDRWNSREGVPVVGRQIDAGYGSGARILRVPCVLHGWQVCMAVAGDGGIRVLLRREDCAPRFDTVVRAGVYAGES